MAGNIGKYVAEFIAKTDGFVGGLRNAQREAAALERRFKPVTKLVEGFGAAATKAGLALTAFGAGFAMIGKRAIDNADNLGDMAERLGETTENLSALAYAARLEGIDMGALETGVQKMQIALAGFGKQAKDAGNKNLLLHNRLQEGAEDAGDFEKGLKELGVTGAQVKEWSNNGAKALVDLNARINAVQNAAKRTELRRSIFGKGGAVMANMPGDTLEKLKAVAAANNQLITPEMARQADAFGKSLNAIKMSVEGIFNSALTPEAVGRITTFNKGISDSIAGFAKGHPEATAYGLAIGGIATAAGPSLLALGFLATGTSKLIGLTADLATGLSSLAVQAGSAWLGMGKLSGLGDLYTALDLHVQSISSGLAGWALPAALGIAVAALAVDLWSSVSAIRAAQDELEKTTKERERLSAKQTPAMIARADAASMAGGHGHYRPDASVTNTGGSFQFAMGIPGFATGTPYVPRTGPAIVHQGERIVPADQNRAGGGNHLTINVNANGAGAKQIAETILSVIRGNQFGFVPDFHEAMARHR